MTKSASNVLQCVGMLAVVMYATPAFATVTATTPSTIIAVEPGAYADIPFVFSNDANETSNEVSYVLDFGFPGYSYEQRSHPACGDLVITEPTIGRGRFSVAPIAAHSQTTCVVRVTRDLSTIDNGFAEWYVETYVNPSLTLITGSFVDLSITATAVSSSINDGTLHQVFRLQAHNGGVIDADNVVLGFSPACVVPTFSADTDLPGGCVTQDLGCGFGGGASGPAVRLPALAAGQTQSCLVRLSAPASAHVNVQSFLAPDLLSNAATGGLIGDLDDTNNSPLLQLVAQPSGSAAVSAPDLGLVAKLLTGFLLLFAAVVHLGAKANHERTSDAREG